MQTLVADLFHHAEARPDKPFAVVWEGETYRILNYADLLDEAHGIAAALAGLPRPGIVHLVLKHSPALYPAYLGCMLAGLVPSFLPFPTPKQDPSLYFSSHEDLFRRSPPAALITSADLAPVLRALVPAGTPVLDVATMAGAGRSDLGPPDLDATALLQHSSGTTGLKKGVALSYRQIARQVAAYAPVAGLSDASVVVSWLPLYHDMGLFTGFLIPLSLGASVVSIDAFDWVRRPSLLLRLVEVFGGTHAWLPNFAFQHILAATGEADRFDLNSLHSLVSCSEPVKPAVLRGFAARFGAAGASLDRLRACYAMAETCFAATQSTGPGPNPTTWFERDTLGRGSHPVAAKAGSAETAVELASNGTAVDGVEVGILTEDGVTRDPSTAVGEIVLRGDIVFGGYHDAPDLTAAAMTEGWYRTGDLGFLRAGELYVCGRLKELIIVHGRNYYCHDIEALVSNVPGIAPGRVVAIGTEGGEAAGEELLIVAEPAHEGADATLLRRAVKAKVFAHLDLTPHTVAFVPRGWLVKTTSGKLSRVENARRLRERLEPDAVA